MTRRVLLLALLLTLAACTPARHTTPTATPPATTLAVAGRPLPAVTPGVVLTTRIADVCTPGWASRHRRGLTDQQKTTVRKSYGLRAGQAVAEWDHLVSLELGGGNGVRNIWPQVSGDAKHRKDLLENKLHWQACNGGITLAQAQDRIRQYWLWW